jgi:hypothetical protein
MCLSGAVPGPIRNFLLEGPMSDNDHSRKIVPLRGLAD